jgi:transcriptional regulator with XRE-family HTH domain
MGFWDNVVKELDYLGMTNKSLAEKCGFDASNIGRGIRLKSSPSVETAVKIAKSLGVSVEFLVDGNESDQNTPQSLGKKYYKTLKNLDSLPEKQRNSIIHMIEEMCR